MTEFEPIKDLINGYVDGTLTDAEILRLQALLVNDPSVADALAFASELATFLDEHFHEAAAARSEGESLIASVLVDHVPDKDRAAIAPVSPQSRVPHPSRSPVLGFLGGAMDYVNHSRMLMFWLVALLVGGWFAFQLGSLMMGRALTWRRAGGEPTCWSPFSRRVYTAGRFVR